MSKLLLLIVVLAAVFFIWKGTRIAKPKPPEPKSAAPVERMVRCAHCGVFLPLSEAVARADEHYCCEQHANQGRADS